MRTHSPDGGTDIKTLVRRVLAEVGTVPVLLVIYLFSSLLSHAFVVFFTYSLYDITRGMMT